MVFVVALLVVATVSFFIIRVGAVALEHTGVSRDAARFQALSAFFGAGFTTRESEIVVNHPIRRRIIRDLIIVGNIGTLSILSAIVLSLRNVDVSNEEGKRKFLVELIVIFGGLVALWLLSRSQIISRTVERSISYSLKHTGVLRALDYEQLLRVHAGYTVAEITLGPDDWLTGQSIGDAQLRHMGVNVLGVTSESGAYNAQPRGATELHEGDTLIVYGSHDAIESARRKRDAQVTEADA